METAHRIETEGLSLLAAVGTAMLGHIKVKLQLGEARLLLRPHWGTLSLCHELMSLDHSPGLKLSLMQFWAHLVIAPRLMLGWT